VDVIDTAHFVLRDLSRLEQSNTIIRVDDRLLDARVVPNSL
jgi:hypothetical protein